MDANDIPAGVHTAEMMLHLDSARGISGHGAVLLP
jgi:hypothetical protein